MCVCVCECAISGELKISLYNDRSMWLIFILPCHLLSGCERSWLFLSFVIHIISGSFTFHLFVLPSILSKSSNRLIVIFTLASISLICSMSVKFSRLSFHIMCNRNFSCLWLLTAFSCSSCYSHSPSRYSRLRQVFSFIGENIVLL